MCTYVTNTVYLLAVPLWVRRHLQPWHGAAGVGGDNNSAILKKKKNLKSMSLVSQVKFNSILFMFRSPLALTWEKSFNSSEVLLK